MDRIIQSKLHDHPSQLPAGMWDRIEEGIDEKKKRKGGAWYWIGGLALTLVVGFAIAQMMTSGQEGAQVRDSSELESVEVLSSNMSQISSEAMALSPNSLEASEGNKVASESPELEGDADSKFVEKRIKNKDVKVSAGGFRSLNALENESNSSEVHIDKVKDFTSTSSLIELDKAFTADQNPIVEEREKIDIEKRLQILNSPKLPTCCKLLVSEVRNFKDPTGCPNFSSRIKANIFVEAYYQPLYAFSMLSSNSPEIGDSYLNLRRDSEHNLYSWSAGINVGWISDYNVGVQVGADYEVINERFTFEDPAAIRNQTVIVIDTIFNTDGSFNVQMDTSIVQVNGAETQRIANHHRSLSIPIHALYQMNYGNFALEISGGPIFNISYSNRGKIVDPSNEAQWFTNGESGSYNVYKNRMSVSFSLSVNALYSINENIQLFARPQVKYHPTTISKTSSPFNQKYLNTGLALGARYYFSGNPNY